MKMIPDENDFSFCTRLHAIGQNVMVAEIQEALTELDRRLRNTFHANGGAGDDKQRNIVQRHIDQMKCLLDAARARFVDVKRPLTIASLDVESIGLYGDPTSWALCVSNPEGVVIAEYAAQLANVHATAKQFDEGRDGDRAWYRDNVGPATTPEAWAGLWESSPVAFVRKRKTPMEYVNTVEELYRSFRAHWETLMLADVNTVLLADCPYPVESSFLKHAMPPGKIYPLLDVNTLAHLLGIEEYDRKPDELPKHNPLADARQSRRMYYELAARIQVKQPDPWLSGYGLALNDRTVTQTYYKWTPAMVDMLKKAKGEWNSFSMSADGLSFPASSMKLMSADIVSTDTAHSPILGTGEVHKQPIGHVLRLTWSLKKD